MYTRAQFVERFHALAGGITKLGSIGADGGKAVAAAMLPLLQPAGSGADYAQIGKTRTFIRQALPPHASL
jgi:hypothetical protein